MALQFLNELIILLISFGCFEVKKKELITLVGAVVFISLVSTGRMVSVFFSYVGKECIEIFKNRSYRISYQVTYFGVKLVYVNLFRRFLVY